MVVCYSIERREDIRGEKLSIGGSPALRSSDIRAARECDAALPVRHCRRRRPQSSQPALVHGVALQSVPSSGFLPGVSPASKNTNTHQTSMAHTLVDAQSQNVLTSRAIEPPTCISGPARFSWIMIHLRITCEMGADNFGKNEGNGMLTGDNRKSRRREERREGEREGGGLTRPLRGSAPW